MMELVTLEEVAEKFTKLGEGDSPIRDIMPTCEWVLTTIEKNNHIFGSMTSFLLSSSNLLYKLTHDAMDDT